MMQLNLRNSGSFLLTTDQYHMRANYEHDLPQGWASGDQAEWWRSHQKVQMLVKNLGIKLIFGHDAQVYRCQPHTETLDTKW